MCVRARAHVRRRVRTCWCVCVCAATRAASGLCDDLLLLLSSLCFYPVNVGCNCGATACLFKRKYKKNTAAAERPDVTRPLNKQGSSIHSCGRPVRAAARLDHFRGGKGRLRHGEKEGLEWVSVLQKLGSLTLLLCLQVSLKKIITIIIKSPLSRGSLSSISSVSTTPPSPSTTHPAFLLFSAYPPASPCLQHSCTSSLFSSHRSRWCSSGHSGLDISAQRM